MEFQSTLSKMPAFLDGKVKYLFKTDDDFLKMNDLVGRSLSLKFLNEKYCASCGGKFDELYRMGFCKNCFFTAPEAGESIIRPELSRAHLGEADRDLAYEKSYQLMPHVVYLANSGGLKVGVTRQRNLPTRWIDQGASEAIIFAETSNRYEAGQLEVALKNHLSDKTAWQRMLKNEDPEMDLAAEKKKVIPELSEELQKFVSQDNTIQKLEYPIQNIPTKVKALNLDKNPEFSAVLQGIRGQYLIFEGGVVFNVRGNTGYRVAVSV